MDANSMKAAMDMMKNMPPEQLQRMMGSMGNISPDMMAQAQSMASRMSPDDWKRAQEAMSSASPDELQRQAAQAQTQFAAQQKYTISASQQVKNEGNQLHSSGRYQEAIDKYLRAKQNVEAFTQPEAVELRKACTLNLSSCYLNLKEYGQCVLQCNKVLQGEPESLKALYRRGQAYLGLSQWAEAVDDLSRALKLSSHDPAQQKLIREKLQDAKDQLSIQRASAALQQNNGSASTLTAPAPAPTPAPPPAPAAPAPAPAASYQAPAGPVPPVMDPKMLQTAAEQLRKNPDLIKQAEKMMEGMSDEQLREMSRSAFGQELTREQLQQQRALAKNLSPEQLENLAKLQDSSAAARLRTNPQDPEALASTSRLLQENPDMLKSVADMMSSMSPDQLAAMAQQTGLPPDSLSPDMIKAAAESFKNMKPEEVAAMTEMAAKMRPPPAFGGGASSSAASSAAGASTATGSRPSALAASAAGVPGAAAATGGGLAMGGPMPPGMPAITPEMAKMAADMMAGMKPEDMQRMMSAMGGPGGMGAMGAMGGAPGGMPPGGLGGNLDMLGQMNPQMMEGAMNMMRNMDPQALASMLVSSGMAKTPEQAEQMAKQMRGMSDTQMKMMVKAANVVQSGAQALRKTKEALSSRTMLFVGIAVLLIAVLLRYFGIM